MSLSMILTLHARLLLMSRLHFSCVVNLSPGVLLHYRYYARSAIIGLIPLPRDQTALLIMGQSHDEMCIVSGDIEDVARRLSTGASKL